jgi:DNA polymerase-3 subunit epsilon
MLNKYLLAMIDTRLPNRRIDVSRLYYDRKYGTALPARASICAMQRFAPH